MKKNFNIQNGERNNKRLEMKLKENITDNFLSFHDTVQLVVNHYNVSNNKIHT